MKIKIATDSTADIPRELCEKWNISVLPLTIIDNGKEYRVIRSYPLDGERLELVCGDIAEGQ